MKDLSLWVGHGLVAIIAVVLFKLIASRIPVPALQKLGAFI